MSAVRIHYTHTTEANVLQVVGTVDGHRALKTSFRYRDAAHLRGMLRHDLKHVLAGIGFSLDEERTLKATKTTLTEAQIVKCERAADRLIAGKNVLFS